ncbi:hypothetical protein [Spirosoma flavum]|uniref:Uncharacterized protein n=1 Tax=Spirosoma flavum TaxID=2048557 RepID=A0ABW6AP50_9BACT
MLPLNNYHPAPTYVALMKKSGFPTRISHFDNLIALLIENGRHFRLDNRPISLID